MELKVKFSGWSAGRPVAIINEKTAKQLALHVNDRILIENKRRKVIAVIDTAEKIAKPKELYVSKEVVSHLKLTKRDKVEISIAKKPRAVHLIEKKIQGKQLTYKELYTIIYNIVHNALTEAEIAYFVSSVYKSGMEMKETADLTRAIYETGKTLKLKKKKVVDKHSIGGIPGRTTPIVISICSATGLTMPKTSSRAITTPAGTADVMETICKVDFKIPEIKKIIQKTNACIVWGGSLGLAPADDKLIQIERILNIDPQPQLLASIMAKKLAVGSNYILIDLPYGKNAKVNKKQAQNLSKKFKQLAKFFHVKLETNLAEINEPLGNGVGPVLEMQDVIRILKGENYCHRLKTRSLELAANILELSGKAKKGKGKKLAKQILDSGQALEQFQKIVKAQKGNINRIKNKQAKYHKHIKAKKSGKIKTINTKLINILSRTAGCPLDKYAGLYIYKHVGDKVEKKEKILTIYAQSRHKLRHAINFYKKNKIIVI